MPDAIQATPDDHDELCPARDGRHLYNECICDTLRACRADERQKALNA